MTVLAGGKVKRWGGGELIPVELHFRSVLNADNGSTSSEAMIAMAQGQRGLEDDERTWSTAIAGVVNRVEKRMSTNKQKKDNASGLSRASGQSEKAETTKEITKKQSEIAINYG